jgi:hypothetical protein
MARFLLHDSHKDCYRQFGRPAGVLTFRNRDLAEDFRYHAGKLVVEEKRWRVVELDEPDFSVLVAKCNQHGKYYERVSEDTYKLRTIEMPSSAV